MCLKILSAPPGLRQFLATESPLKMMNAVFYFPSKAFFVLQIFKSLFWRFGNVSKRLYWKDIYIYIYKVNFKFYVVTTWLTNSNTHTAQYLEKKRQSDNEIWSVNKTRVCNTRNIFLEKSCLNCSGETSPRPFSEKLKLSTPLDQ